MFFTAMGAVVGSLVLGASLGTIAGVAVSSLVGAAVGGIVGNKIMGRSTTLGSVLGDVVSVGVGSALSGAATMGSLLGKTGAKVVGQSIGSALGTAVRGDKVNLANVAMNAAAGYALSSATQYFNMEKGSKILTASDMHMTAAEATLDDVSLLTDNLDDARAILDLGQANPTWTIGEAAMEAGLLYDVTEMMKVDIETLTESGLSLDQAIDQMRSASGVTPQMIDSTKMGIEDLLAQKVLTGDLDTAIDELKAQGFRFNDTIETDVFDVKATEANVLDSTYNAPQTGALGVGEAFDISSPAGQAAVVDVGGFFVDNVVEESGWGWDTIKSSLDAVGGLGTIAKIGASLYSQGIAKETAERMAKAQIEAANAAIAAQERGVALSIEEQRRQYDQTRADMLGQRDLTRADMLEQQEKADPFYQQGLEASKKLSGILLGDEDPTEALRATPGYDWLTSEAEKASSRKMARMGMSGSGRAALELERQRIGLADQSYRGYINDLFTMSGYGPAALNIGQNALQTTASAGQSALQTTAAAGQTTSSNISNALTSLGSGTASQLQQAGQARASSYGIQGAAKQSAVTGVATALSEGGVFS